jgi:hypothetical protein
VPTPPPTTQSRTGIPIPPPVNQQSRTGIPSPTPAAQKPPAPAQKEEPKRAWNMDAFEDINEFASSNFSTEGGDDEDFAPMDLSRSTPQPTEAPEELALEPSSEPAQEDWAHQDLSRFKIDLPPVSVESEGLDLKIDMGEEEFTASGFLYKPDARKEAQVPPRFQREEPAQLVEDVLELEQSEDDLTQPILEVPEATAQIGLSLERDEIPEPLEPLVPDFRDPARGGAGIPQLSADRIEEIIRAQSREIIEDVVRRIVPDIATELIREELERLLEESSVRDTRRREPRP